MVADSGLEHLHVVTELQSLNLLGIQVAATGVKKTSASDTQAHIKHSIAPFTAQLPHPKPQSPR
ncbi:hypothetical protein Q31a_19250 [Aureliella helgolandensis]|uniref:Uncharacterized protein n=1 Tax=Aureliella helgolandensis TaxID=2527968 RepID=A0A518G4X0_9BACT|nr:hypothetical protein Q31a_19250 [Aureliella helgolandensis]